VPAIEANVDYRDLRNQLLRLESLLAPSKRPSISVPRKRPPPLVAPAQKGQRSPPYASVPGPTVLHTRRTKSRRRTFIAAAIRIRASTEIVFAPRSTAPMYTGCSFARCASFSWLRRACLRRVLMASPRTRRYLGAETGATACYRYRKSKSPLEPIDSFFVHAVLWPGQRRLRQASIHPHPAEISAKASKHGYFFFAQRHALKFAGRRDVAIRTNSS
jgi:hypothetical protein